MEAGITLEGVLLFVLTGLIGISFWGMRRFIDKDDTWKIQTDAKIDALKQQHNQCLEYFAKIRDVDELYERTRQNRESILRIQGKIEACGAHSNSFCKKEDE